VLTSRPQYDDPDLAREYKLAIAELLYAVDEEEEKPSDFWPPWPWPPQDPPKRENKTERAKRLSTGVFEFEKSLAIMSENS
jgi:hypothetical protein